MPQATNYERVLDAIFRKARLRGPRLWSRKRLISRSGLFDEEWFRSEYPEAARDGLDPLTHYLNHGVLSDQNPNPFFDTRWYLREYPDVLAAAQNPLVHFIKHGAAEGRNPSPRFNTRWYLAENADVRETGRNPLHHFLHFGINEGRKPNPNGFAATPGIRVLKGAERSSALPVPAQPGAFPEGFGSRPSVLMIDSVYPRPDQDSGSIDAFNYVRIFRDFGYDVIFIADAEFDTDTPKYRALLEQQLGVWCVRPPYCSSPQEFLSRYGDLIDVLFLSRVYSGGRHFESALQCANSKIIFNPVDLHFVRDGHEARLKNDRRALNLSFGTRERELHLCRSADATLVVSESERQMLEKLVPGCLTVSVPLMRDCPGRAAPFGSRSDIGFIGGFLHSPNVDAVSAFLAETWPLVRNRVPDLNLRVIGAAIPDFLRDRNEPGVVWVGHVADIEAAFAQLRVSIAPLRYGAGAKGKIVTSLAHGVPCVATPVAVEGMGLTDGSDIVVGHDAADFANKIVSVYEDETAWLRLSDGGLETVRSKHGYVYGRKRVGEVLVAIGAPMTASLEAELGRQSS
jgi:glycosyltransferase involved in cell wall biosynthesis